VFSSTAGIFICWFPLSFGTARSLAGIEQSRARHLAVDLSIIIVNWNSRDFLKACLESLHLEDWPVAYEVIVIDGASYDGCGEMLGRLFPSVRFIQSEKNLGFAKANNVAFREARGSTVLFLNPDTIIAGDAIQRMYAALCEDDRAGVLGCRLLNADGSLQTSCVQSIPTILNQLLDSEYLRARWPKSRLWGTAALYETGAKPIEVEAISGACVMIRREKFERVGLFAEDYFMYAEDIDLSFKCRRMGLRNLYLPSAQVYHLGGSSASQAASHFAVVMMRDSIAKFFRVWRGTLYASLYRATTLLGALGRLGIIKVSTLLGRRMDLAQAASKWRAILAWGINPRNCVTALRQVR
jgi:GT2 family glycosyltransferase